MKIYNKPELNVEKFDVEEVITATSPATGNNTGTSNDVIEWSAGMEFDITAEGNEF